MPRSFQRGPTRTPFAAKVRHFHRRPEARGGDELRLFEWRDVRGFLLRLLVTVLVAGFLFAAACWLWKALGGHAPAAKPPSVARPADPAR